MAETIGEIALGAVGLSQSVLLQTIGIGATSVLTRRCRHRGSYGSVRRARAIPGERQSMTAVNIIRKPNEMAKSALSDLQGFTGRLRERGFHRRQIKTIEMAALYEIKNATALAKRHVWN